jgi:hypothetical protein
MKAKLFTSVVWICLPIHIILSQKQTCQIIHGPNFKRSIIDTAFSAKVRSFGLAVVDINNDTYPDLFFNNMTTVSTFFLNNQGNSFQKLEADSLTDNIGWATGQSWADYDNDGYADLLLTYQDFKGNRLFRNLGNGKFERIRTNYVTTDKANSFHPAWADINNDGYVDLLITNNTYFAKKEETSHFIYLNEKNGTFSPFIDTVLTKLKVSSSSSNFCDYDNDGDADLLVTSWGSGAFIYKNKGKGNYEKVCNLSGANGNLITCTWMDYDTDGDFDIFITRGWPDPETNLLYRNDGKDTFTLLKDSEILKPTGNFWNAGWGDFDNDGDLDLCYTDLSKLNYLFENNGNGDFKKLTNEITVTDTTAKYACADLWADIDKDGDLDLILANIFSGWSPIFENKGNSNRWIEIQCEGTTSNRSAIGTVVKVKAAINRKEVTQIRQVASVEAFRTVNHLLHFGLGDAKTIDEIIIIWPSGKKQIMKNVNTDQYLVIKEEEHTP